MSYISVFLVSFVVLRLVNPFPALSDSEIKVAAASFQFPYFE